MKSENKRGRICYPEYCIGDLAEFLPQNITSIFEDRMPVGQKFLFRHAETVTLRQSHYNPICMLNHTSSTTMIVGNGHGDK
jgi:hypothetical protein